MLVRSPKQCTRLSHSTGQSFLRRRNVGCISVQQPAQRKIQLFFAMPNRQRHATSFSRATKTLDFSTNASKFSTGSGLEKNLQWCFPKQEDRPKTLAQHPVLGSYIRSTRGQAGSGNNRMVHSFVHCIFQRKSGGCFGIPKTPPILHPIESNPTGIIPTIKRRCFA